MASADGGTVKCLCQDCVCVIPVSKVVSEDGRARRRESCAAGHADHDGCDHAGCTCHG